MQVEAFNQVAKILRDNKGKRRVVHLVLKDGTTFILLRIDENDNRTGGYSVNGVDCCIYWTYIGGNYAEEHITSLDSVMDVYVNIIS